MDKIEVSFKDSDSTKKRLIKATTALIAQYGYDSVSTREIAQTAGVVLSAISFHFGTKEKLVKESIEYSARILSESFADINKEIEEYLESENHSVEKGMALVDKYMADWIHQTFDEKSKSRIIIGINEHENGFPEGIKGLMASKSIEVGEKIFTKLLFSLSDNISEVKAFVIARSFYSSVMTYIEKTVLTKEFTDSLDITYSGPHSIENELHDFFLESIRAAL